MARARFIPPQPKSDAWHRARICSACHEPYTRRNLTEVWDARNAGHRDGWHKTVAKVCLKCLSQKQAQRVLVLVHVPPRPSPEPTSG